MHILHSDLKKGIIKLQTESLDDLWTLYNVIKPGDLIKARTMRRVVLREGDKGERKPMTLEIRVENVEFHEFSNRLRVKGQITAGPDDYVSIGQYHTINIEIPYKLTIYKEKWYKHELKRLGRKSSDSKNDYIIITALENGLANIALLSNYSMNIISTIRKNIPGKRYSKQNFNAALGSFFDNITQVIAENVQKYSINLVILAGPGFLKERYQQILKEYAKKEKIPLSITALSASSGTESGILEVLRRGEIADIVANHQISKEVALMEKFIENMGKENGLIAYGIDEVLEAANSGAVEDLMITDLLMRTITTDKQKRIEEIFTSTESGRGNIHIFSTMHPAGEQLQGFGGIAAILRYRLA